MLTLGWVAGLLRHRRVRLAATAGGITIAVALLACLGGFLATAKATMTQRSIQRGTVDWQGQGPPGPRPPPRPAPRPPDPPLRPPPPGGDATRAGPSAPL